ncbi:TPA: cyclase family protein [Methanosarcina acetivorans]|uniref:Cyclase family protein n=1 Tax=Methanosarcina acetivorans TaxID=2214 RepID=A0A832W9R1_9EURY|nr:cyclase family protein [Methanosarcina acetivorans]HIH95253.1 cyclase family protein [Methanosarcina acetivorans]
MLANEWGVHSAGVFDVSKLITEEMVVYPGNPGPSIERYASLPKDGVNESVLTPGCHTGTHVDSRLHLREGKEGVSSLPLESFYGKCRVFDLVHVEEEIHRQDLEGFQIDPGDIVFLKTRNSALGYIKFLENYVHLKMDAVEYPVSAGVKTLGFDYFRVKKLEGDDEVHELLLNNMTLFEGLNLAGVHEGEYTILGLPLHIDAGVAPARIILIKE